MKDRLSLLPPDSLSGVRLGLSVSESADLLHLGLLESHFRMALGEIARCVLVSAGKLVYGGHLRPDGYTSFLIQELERYSRRDRPMQVCLAWSEHRGMTSSELDREKQYLGLYGEILCLDQDGNVVKPITRGIAAGTDTLDEETRQKSLSALRRFLIENTDGRVFLGGKRDGFQGQMPGLLEEAIYAIEKRQPVYLAAGFGGLTRDIASALAIIDRASMSSTNNQDSDRLARSIARLIEIAHATNNESLDNGLSRKENLRLADCHRPSEIAALVGLGLGRRFSRGG